MAVFPSEEVSGGVVGGSLLGVSVVSYVTPSESILRVGERGVIVGVVGCVRSVGVIGVIVVGGLRGVVGLFVGAWSWAPWLSGSSVAIDHGGAGVWIGAWIAFQSNVGGRSLMSRKQSRG